MHARVARGGGGCGDDGGKVGSDAATETDAQVETNDVADSASDIAGLGVDYGAGGVSLRYEPGAREFTATPWPSDRLLKDGHVDLGTFPNPNDIIIIDRYLEYGEEVLDGWSRNALIYFQLSCCSHGVAAVGRDDDARPEGDLVQLVDVTAGGAHYGDCWLLVFEQVDGKDDPFYLGPTLAMRPVFGFPLADAGRYCAFVTRAVKGADGKYLAATPAFASALDSEPSLEPLRTWLATSPFVASDLASATCFTTQDATREMRLLESFIATRPSTAPEELEYTGKTQNFYALLAGTTRRTSRAAKAYRDEGGDLKLDGDGKPIVQEDERVRFRLRSAQRDDAGRGLADYLLFARHLRRLEDVYRRQRGAGRARRARHDLRRPAAPRGRAASTRPPRRTTSSPTS